MFGYVKTDIPNMFVKDTVLYKAAYCGLCKSIGQSCGQCPRFTLNYDLAFLSLLCHNLCDVDMEIEKKRCVAHWFRRRPIARPDRLSKRIAALNVILAYYKLSDDVLDEGKGRIKRSIFSKGYKKAAKSEPLLDKIVKTRFDELLKYEKTGGSAIDLAADPFGKMMSELIEQLCGSVATDEVKELAYFLGKWIYLIDALDDFDKDKKKKEFNVFVNAYPDINDKNALIREKNSDIALAFGTILNIVSIKAKELKYNFNHDLIDNVLTFGIKEQTKKVMENKKCRKTTKS